VHFAPTLLFLRIKHLEKWWVHFAPTSVSVRIGVVVVLIYKGIKSELLLSTVFLGLNCSDMIKKMAAIFPLASDLYIGNLKSHEVLDR